MCITATKILWARRTISQIEVEKARGFTKLPETFVVLCALVSEKDRAETERNESVSPLYPAE
jgi:hypothetical protein